MDTLKGWSVHVRECVWVQDCEGMCVHRPVWVNGYWKSKSTRQATASSDPKDFHGSPKVPAFLRETLVNPQDITCILHFSEEETLWPSPPHADNGNTDLVSPSPTQLKSRFLVISTPRLPVSAGPPHSLASHSSKGFILPRFSPWFL